MKDAILSPAADPVPIPGAHVDFQRKSIGRLGGLLKRIGPVACGLLLVVTCGVAITIKIHESTRLSYYDPDDGAHFYWTESAFHFRMAEMVSTGQGIPRIDIAAQYPEGVDTSRHLTPLMDRFYGTVHRWFFSDVPLHRFLIYAVSVFSTLSIAACFAACMALWNNSWIALGAAGLYALAPASFARTIGQYLHEDFALPFLFGAFACFLFCMRRERVSIAVLGAVLTLIGLQAWHMSEYFIQLLVLGMGGLLLVYPRYRLPRMTFSIWFAALVIIALASPVLREKHFIVSMTMTTAGAVFVSCWLLPSRWARWKVAGTTALMVLFAVAIAHSFTQLTGAQAHVFGVILAKVSYLGQLPADPMVLSFDERILWSSSFATPSSSEVLMMLSTTLLFGTMGVIAGAWCAVRRNLEPRVLLVMFLAAATFFLFLLFVRLYVFSVFFMVLLLGAIWPGKLIQLKGYSRTRSSIRCALALLAIGCIGFELHKYGRLSFHPARVPVVFVSGVTDWLHEHTDPDDVLLTPFDGGAPILTYGGRPVILHPKFESAAYRAKVERVYSAFYDDESALHRVAVDYGAQYLVYQSDLVSPLRGDMMYRLGHKTMPENSSAFLLHFFPHRLGSFRLVYQNDQYRIFRVIYGDPDEAAHPEIHAPLPPYDLGFYASDPHATRISADEYLQGLERLDRVLPWSNAANKHAIAGRFDEALALYGEALRIHPRQGRVLNEVAMIRMLRGDIEGAADALAAAIIVEPSFDPDPDQPWLAEACLTFGLANMQMRKFAEAEVWFRRALQRSPLRGTIHMHLGDALLQQRRLNEAETALYHSLRHNPRSYRTYELFGQLYGYRGEFGNAIAMVEYSLEINPVQPRLMDVLDRLRAEMEKADRE